jgi:hypothetical protein
MDEKLPRIRTEPFISNPNLGGTRGNLNLFNIPELSKFNNS